MSQHLLLTIKASENKKNSALKLRRAVKISDRL